MHCVDVIAPLSGALEPNDWPLFNPLDYEHFHYYPEDCRAWFTRVMDTDFTYAFHLAAMVGGRAMIENNPLAVADDLSIDAAYWQWKGAGAPCQKYCLVRVRLIRFICNVPIIICF